MIKEVIGIKFEHSPGRKDKNYTGDSSAFDVFVEYISTKQKKGFIGIEVKCAEDLILKPKEVKQTYNKNGKRYLEISKASNIFTVISPPSSLPSRYSMYSLAGLGCMLMRLIVPM